MRYMVGLVLVLALGVTGCNQSTAGPIGGSGGSAGMGGGGTGGEGGAIGEVFPCTEQGIRDAIAEGGPHAFACDGAQPVVTQAEIVVDNNVILDGQGNLTVDGDDDHIVFRVAEGTTAELRSLVVTNGRSVPFGCIVNDGDLTLTNSTVSRCTSQGDFPGDIGPSASGIANEGALTLVDSEVVENDGGEALRNGASRSMTLVRTTVSRNPGGGIFNGTGSLVVIESVVSNNRFGIFVDGDGASLLLVNSTVSGNTADEEGSAIGNSGVSSLSLVNSTVSGRVGIFSVGTLTVSGSVIEGLCESDSDSEIISGGYNIESPGNTCGFDQTGDQAAVSADDLKLGELADNGGPTETHALLPGSVAIDQIPAEDCVDDTDGGAPLTTDQRGEPRPAGDACDVGAFERQPDEP